MFNVRHKSVIKIQTQLNTAMEVSNEVSNLKSSLQAQRDVDFVGIMTKRTLSKLMEREGDVTKQQAEDFVNKAAEFYDTCIEYIDRWNHSDDVNKLSFVLLEPLTWHEVDAANEMICNIVGRSSSADNIDCLTKQHV